ncbi:capsid protein [Desulfobaculum xiamenense]|uniref:Capsid protein n=1 Tax=Desulfobaculum xiamenense TaxID=995050 RepID=A0A846QDJ1_9BACT|nr:phage portal protein [Desulfobaculum xiamenense]NJB66448.1 capsid protein [Desulfobaculum xiamenense]
MNASRTAPMRGRHAVRHGAARTGTMSNWTNSIVTRRLAEMQRRQVEDRALDLYTNDAMAHGLLEGLTAEGVGIGLTPQLAPDAEWLGLSDAWRHEFQRAGAKLFERWGMDCRFFCDAQRRLNFYGLQALAWFNWRLFGVGLFQVLADDDPMNPLPLSVLPLDPMRLSDPAPGTRAEVCDGVEIDHDGRPVAVHLSRAMGQPAVRVPVRDEATGLPRVLMVCDVRNVGEYRQDSILGSMIKELRDNKDFVDAALVRTLIANMFVMNLQHVSAGGRLGNSWDERYEELEQAILLHTGPQEDVRFLSNDAPGPNYEKMFDSIVKRLGMATGRGPENVSREYKASYSASRASMNKSEQLTETEQHLVLNPHFNQPLLAWMLYAGAVRGLVPVADLGHMRANLHDYTRAQWLPQPPKHIDPLKTASANKVNHAIGERSYRDACAEQGKDWQEALRQRAEERAFIRDLEDEYGVSLGLGAGTAPAARTQSAADEETEHAEDE